MGGESTRGEGGERREGKGRGREGARAP